VAKEPDQQDDQRDASPTAAELAARQDSLEGKLDQILGILGTKEGQAQGKAQDARTAELDAPTSVAEEIRTQLEERDRKAKADAAAAEHGQWKTKVDETLAAMTEQAPEPPARKIEKLMGWRR
jgi:hypothetical protein